jgi:MFS family permease
VSFALIGAAIGCLIGGPFSDKYGRKKTIILTDVFFILGSLLMGHSGNMFILLSGRFIAGVFS